VPHRTQDPARLEEVRDGVGNLCRPGAPSFTAIEGRRLDKALGVNVVLGFAHQPRDVRTRPGHEDGLDGLPRCRGQVADHLHRARAVGALGAADRGG
jgi:hypothetical protein